MIPVWFDRQLIGSRIQSRCPCCQTTASMPFSIAVLISYFLITISMPLFPCRSLYALLPRHQRRFPCFRPQPRWPSRPQPQYPIPPLQPRHPTSQTTRSSIEAQPETRPTFSQTQALTMVERQTLTMIQRRSPNRRRDRASRRRRRARERGGGEGWWWTLYLGSRW